LKELGSSARIPEGENLAIRLQELFENMKFPSEIRLKEMLMDSWRKRKQQLKPSERGEFFKISEDEASHILGRIATLLFVECAQIPELRDPLLVMAHLEMPSPVTSTNPTLAGKLKPINGQGMNVVLLGINRHQPNAEFRFSTRFHFLVGDLPLTLLSFEGLYLAYGCHCLYGPPTLKIGDTDIPFIEDMKTFMEPIQVAPNHAITIQHGRKMRPPLMSSSPSDCDEGDLEVTMSFSEQSRAEITTVESKFKFSPGGKLEEISKIRPVPRLDDDELEQWKIAGKLSAESFERLIKINPVYRYMGAVSGNDDFFDSVENVDRDTLRKLLREGKP
jgi:hypothetical protein